MSALGIHVTQNQRYDALASKIMRKTLRKDSTCVDVGCHKGEVLEEMLRLAPDGKHFAFEPIPELYQNLRTKFNGHVKVHQLALSDDAGEVTFQHVVSNPAYSGIRKRTYKGDEDIEVIKVQQDRLDSILPEGVAIDFMKIDVEGAEMQVLKGAKERIRASKPVIIFEHGLGASDHYGTTPEMIYDLLATDCGLMVSLMEDYLEGEKPLSKEEFKEQFYKSLNYYFVAYPEEVA